MASSSRGSILHHLRNREIQKTRPMTSVRQVRAYYETIVPNTTITGVSAPDVFIRRFICGGKYLVCFSRSLHELRLYRFSGPSAVTAGSPDEISAAFQNQFDAYFRLVYEVVIANGASSLCRDFCLTTADEQYLILASTSAAPRRVTLPSNSLQFLLRQENVTFYVVRIDDGKVTDKVEFKEDFIHLPHHSGVSLFEDFLAVTSIHNQLITLFHITGLGRLVPIRQIGDCCHEDDRLYLTSADTAPSTEPCLHELPVCPEVLGCLPPPPPAPYTALKQRLLSFLHRQALESGDPKALRTFFYNYKAYSDMLIWKMQLLDREHMLIKFGLLEAIVGKNPDAYINSSLLVVYNVATTEIENLFVKALPASFGRLPSNPQQYQESPYLDQQVFGYDERSVNALDRPKSCVESPVRFVSRRTGALRFRLPLGTAARHVNRAKQLTSYVFHPSLPFVMTLQHASNTLNVHFRQ